MLHSLLLCRHIAVNTTCFHTNWFPDDDLETLFTLISEKSGRFQKILKWYCVPSFFLLLLFLGFISNTFPYKVSTRGVIVQGWC